LSNPKQRLVLSDLYSGSIHELLHPPAGQIPFLDGLRTIAILLVVNAHLSAQFAKTFGSNAFSRLPFVIDGWIGVDLFFILSGFFIGGQLWKEIDRTGTVAVGRFILRRGFRIWPLYFFTFLCVFICSLAFGNGLAAREFGWSDLIFLSNYVNHGIVMGGWSLCTEEQFYIVVPLLLFYFASRTPGLRNYRRWLWVVLLSVPLLRAVIWIFTTGHLFVHDPQLFTLIYYASLTHCDGLIMGLIISNLWTAREHPKGKFASPWSLMIIAILLAATLHVIQKEIFDFTTLAFLFGAFAWLGLQRRIAIFNAKPFYWISRLSFGMYLNHEYMVPWIVKSLLPSLITLLHSPVLANLLGFGLLTLLSAAIAIVTFCLVEYPFLQMRKVVLGH
jgi:peptidoglycan/LPS O-acetylase OafA/YrhL